LAHGFYPKNIDHLALDHWQGSILWQKHIAEEICSPNGSQDEREREREVKRGQDPKYPF
jgi:hypothetical protein